MPLASLLSPPGARLLWLHPSQVEWFLLGQWTPVTVSCYFGDPEAEVPASCQVSEFLRIRSGT